MKLKTRNGLFYFQFHHLLQFANLRHGIFTRLNGESRPPYDRLNVGYNTGDDADRVAANRDRMSTCMGNSELVFARQVHQTDILALTGRDEDPDTASKNADGLATHLPGKHLVIQIADCQAILLFDPIKKVIANIHSGWRGSIGNIAGKGVGLMVRRFHCRPANILAGISPSLGPCCAEFIHYQTEIPQPLWKYRIGEHHFDFWKMSADQLADAGLPYQNIEISGICTRCNPHLFFSYRREKTTGRFAALIGLA